MSLVITVTHLTRMRGSRICVAGLTDEARFVRPDCHGFLDRADVPGLFDIGARVELGRVVDLADPPQVENVTFQRAAVTRVGDAGVDALRDLLTRSAKQTLREIFGPKLERPGSRSLRVPVGVGTASLGTLRIHPRDLKLNATSNGALRAMWRDPDFGHVNTPVTDLRLFPDGLDRTRVEQLTAECEQADELYLSVGLTKNWAENPGHWLQLNNILPHRHRPHGQLTDESGAWPQHSKETFESLRERYPKAMEASPRAWAPWNEAEDDALRGAFGRGDTAKTLADRHQRKPGAIRSRLKKLGLME